MQDFNKYIYLLVGASGSGKTTVTSILEDKYGWKSVASYTTRQPRETGERGHTFVTKEEFDALEGICAYTFYHGYDYGATNQQVEESDIYVIDADGVDYFVQHYTGSRIPIVVMLKVSDGDQMYNMMKRGETYEFVLDRQQNDKEAFANLEKRLQFTGLEYMTCHSDEMNTPEVIAQIIYENRRWREMQDENI